MRGRHPGDGRVRPAGEAGFTLVELLVAMALGLAMIGASVALFTSGVRSEPRISERAAQIQAGSVLVERLTRELRQGWEVPVAGSSQIEVLTYVNSASCGGSPAETAIPCRVTYTCTGGSCTRVEAQTDGSSPGTAVTMVEGLTSDAIFGYRPDALEPDYVGVDLVFPAEEGDDAITISDGVALRNPGEET